jgi:DNA adenine methylase
MKPFFNRPGNKISIANQIIEMIPNHTTYIEPFVGSGAILFFKEPSEIEVIGDLDETLINGYKLLKKINENDIEKILTYSAELKTLNNDEKLELMNEFVNMNVKNNGLKLYQVLIKMCNTFAAIGFGKIYRCSIQEKKINKIQEYKNRLKKVKIYNTDYKNIISKYDSPTSFFFLDPPYENSKKIYKNEIMDYEEISEILSNIEGKFLLTINSSSDIMRIFSRFNIKNISVRGRGRGGSNVGSTIRNELIITNY